MAIDGVVIVGGSHGALALARSVGASGGRVTFVTRDSNLTAWSRYVSQTLTWGGPQAETALAFLLNISKLHGLRNHLIIAGGDAEVQFLAENHLELSKHYRIPTPSWQDLHWLCDKPLLYERAKRLSIAIPQTYKLKSVLDVQDQSFRYPLVLKPNMGGGENKITKQKVIRINNCEELIAETSSAAKQIGIQNLVLQELIPGDGENQLSYAAYWSKHGSVGEFVARRTRQYPVDFGLTSTFVEVVEDEDVIIAAHKLLKEANFTGLIEVEFKRDQRDGVLKLLDVNPRPWSWFGLCKCASLDLGALMLEEGWQENAVIQKADLGATWSYTLRDIFAGLTLVKRKELSLISYIKSFAKNRCGATFKIDDPLPALMDLPITMYRVLKRRVFNFDNIG